MSETSLPSVSALNLAISQVRHDVARQEDQGRAVPGATTTRATRIPGADVAARVRDAEQLADQMDRALTAQRMALYQYQASLASIKTSDPVLGSLLSLSA
jgi:hypothetical protein